MPTSKIGLHDLDPSLFETLSNISGSNSQTKIFPLQVVASEDNQTVFPIELDTFDAETDFAFVQSGVTNLFYGADFTIENKNIILNEGVPVGRTLGIYVLKNVTPTNEEDYVTGANLAPGSVTPDKIGGVLPIEKGGTGATTADEALENLGALSKTAVNLADGEILTLLQNSGDSTVFFTNWYDSTNFPDVYGSGVFINATDKREKRLLYVCGWQMFFGAYSTVTNTITWKEVFTAQGGTLSSNAIGLAGGYGQVWCGDNTINIFSRDEPHSNSGRYLMVNNHKSDTNYSVQMVDIYEGNYATAPCYNIFGEHNTELLATHIQNIIQGGNVSMVKSVQRGIISISNNYTGTATINSVNTAKSIVIYGGIRTSSGYNSTMQTQDMSQFTGNLVLTNSTTVTATLGDYASSANIPFQVIEYY